MAQQPGPRKANEYNLSIGNTAFNSIPGLPTTNAVVAGGLPSIGITGFSGFGRQSTNPQWQDPALIDPKVNFTWVRGSHSSGFGYEYEHIWMAVNDNNPLYGSWTYGGGYSLCTAATSATCTNNINGTATSHKPVSDAHWADFLFGTTNQYSLANFYEEAHLTQNMHSVYAQDDWKVNSGLTLNLGLRWEYGSPYSDLYNRISNFDPVSRIGAPATTPGAVAGNGITPVSYGGTYGKTLVNPDHRDFGPRVLRLRHRQQDRDPRQPRHQLPSTTLAPAPGDILGIGTPQGIQFRLGHPDRAHHLQPLLLAAARADHRHREHHALLLRHLRPGLPPGLVASFNKATDNITYIPMNNKAGYVESYFLDVQRALAKNTLLDIASIPAATA